MKYHQGQINRCRPGHGASCALCCGSHNYALGPDEVEDLFIARGRQSASHVPAHPERGDFEKLFKDAMQCPNLGIDPSEPGTVCCLIYEEVDLEKSIGKFFNGTCKTFYCPAWQELDDRQVLFAARLMGDWYYYSLFINHIESVQEMCARFDSPEDVPEEDLRALKEELVDIFIEEDGK